MAIKSASKRGKIGRKLILSYMLVLIVAFLVVGIIFRISLTNYLLNQAKKELRSEGQRIAKNLSKVSFEKEEIGKRLINARYLKVLGQYIDAKIMVLDRDRKPIYSSFNNNSYKRMLATLKNPKEFKERGFVAVQVPIKKDDRVMGHLILFTKVKEIFGLNRVRFTMLLISFLVAAVVALIVSLFLERSLVKPIMKLRNKINNFSIKEFDEVNIKTNDEIEELANSFNLMANKLKSYDERQRRFLQNASHELKTPLMSIQGYAEGIRDGIIEGDDLGESLDIIIEESQRLKKLVEEIIYLTKLENIEESFEFEEASISEIVERAIRSVNSLAMDRGIEIKLETQDESLGNYDIQKMKRVFINLIGNAIRYARKNILVSIKDKGDSRIIEVIDDGRGFKDDEDKKIFERFYKGQRGESGIGLAITEAIIKGHGGRIYAYNHESLGAVFKINLHK